MREYAHAPVSLRGRECVIHRKRRVRARELPAELAGRETADQQCHRQRVPRRFSRRVPRCLSQAATPCSVVQAPQTRNSTPPRRL